MALLWGAFGSRIKTLPYFVIYGIALPVWVLWPELATFLQTGDATVLPRRIMDVDYMRNYISFAETTAAPQAGIVKKKSPRKWRKRTWRKRKWRKRRTRRARRHRQNDPFAALFRDLRKAGRVKKRRRQVRRRYRPRKRFRY